MRYLIITLIPFAAYSTIRWCSVGHWGLVSFGGYNSVAIAAQFLEADDLERLPTNLRPLATEILSRIEQTPDVEPRTSFESLERNYIRLQYPVILAAATDVVGREPVRLNHELTRLSSELFRQHPKEYVRWLLWNLRHAVKQSLLLTISDPAVLGLTGLGFALLAFQLFLPSLRPSERVATSDLVPASRQATLEVHVLWWSALGLAAAQTALIILVQPAIGRYMLSAIVLIPSALATQLGTQLGVWNRQSDSAGNRRS